MLITRLSPVSQEYHTLDVPCTEEQLHAWQNGSGHIQDIMPNVEPEFREFLISGITPEEWDDLFGYDEEDVEIDPADFGEDD